MADELRVETLGHYLYDEAVEKRPTRSIVTEYSLLREIPHDKCLDDKNLELKILHLAAWAGDLDTVRELRSQGLADPAARTTGGFTALHLAASRGYTEVVDELVTWLHADAEPVSDRGFTPLHLAVYGGHTETVEFLLKARDRLSIDVNAQDQIFGRSALHFGVLSGSEDVVKKLMSVDGVVIDLKDTVRELSPFLLAAMQSTEKCKLGIVLGLLDKDPKQITCKVGPLHMVDHFYMESWQPLTGISKDDSVTPVPVPDVAAVKKDEKDGTLTGMSRDDSVKPVPDVAAVKKDGKDGYQRCGVQMTGHNVFHVAATQGNAELMKRLLSRPLVAPLLNEKAKFGMTPLHCAIWVNCKPVISGLVNNESVDINSQLDIDPPCCLRTNPVWVPPASEFDLSIFSDLSEHISNTVGSVVHGDTPFHLAIRMWEAGHLIDLVPAFLNHPKFNGAILNGEHQSSLELAWVRQGWCAGVPLRSIVPFIILGSFRALCRGKDRYRKNNDFSEMITVLERHPSNAPVIAQREGLRKEVLGSLSAFMVTATLLANLAVAGVLHLPSGTDGAERTSNRVKLFWIFNTLSFFYAVRCILSSLHLIQSDDRQLYLLGSSLYLAIVRVRGVVPLTVSVGYGILACVFAGFVNVPSDTEPILIACTVVGGLLVLYQWYQNLSVRIQALLPLQGDLKYYDLRVMCVIQPQTMLFHLLFLPHYLPFLPLIWIGFRLASPEFREKWIFRFKIRPEFFRQVVVANYRLSVMIHLYIAGFVFSYALLYVVNP